MAINQNHLFEELNGVKCAIVEKNASTERVEFLKNILEYNRFVVVTAPTPPPKAVPVKPGIEPVVLEPGLPAEETFTIGVTDVMFNPTNAIFGRLLKTPRGHIVTLRYWQQKDRISNDDVPYFES